MEAPKNCPAVQGQLGLVDDVVHKDEHDVDSKREDIKENIRDCQERAKRAVVVAAAAKPPTIYFDHLKRQWFSLFSVIFLIFRRPIFLGIHDFSLDFKLSYWSILKNSLQSYAVISCGFCEVAR